MRTFRLKAALAAVGIVGVGVAGAQHLTTEPVGVTYDTPTASARAWGVERHGDGWTGDPARVELHIYVAPAGDCTRPATQCRRHYVAENRPGTLGKWAYLVDSVQSTDGTWSVVSFDETEHNRP